MSLDVGWSYYDVFSITGSCFNAGAKNPSGLTACLAPNVPSIWKYRSDSNSGYVNLYVKPVRRVTAMVGYDVTSTTGNDPAVVYRADNGQAYR